jgi:hypothetical protein
MTVEDLRQEKAETALITSCLMRLSGLVTELIETQEALPSIISAFNEKPERDIREALRNTFKDALPKHLRTPENYKILIDECFVVFQQTLFLLEELHPFIVSVFEDNKDAIRSFLKSSKQGLELEGLDTDESEDDTLVVPDFNDCFPGPESNHVS